MALTLKMNMQRIGEAAIVESGLVSPQVGHEGMQGFRREKDQLPGRRNDKGTVTGLQSSAIKTWRRWARASS